MTLPTLEEWVEHYDEDHIAERRKAHAEVGGWRNSEMCRMTMALYWWNRMAEGAVSREEVRLP